MSYVAPYLFIIDTDSYAGNFERQLCAYTTGILGECGMGHEEAAQAMDDFAHQSPFEDYITMEADEHGCARPVSIVPTPGHPTTQYNSVAIFFEELPSPELLRIAQERATSFCAARGICIAGSRVLKRTITEEELQAL